MAYHAAGTGWKAHRAETTKAAPVVHNEEGGEDGCRRSCNIIMHKKP